MWYKCLLLLILLAEGVQDSRSQSLAYRPVKDWPVQGGRGVPDYGKGMVVGVATDRQGKVYVFQRTSHPLLVFDREGHFLRSWGKGIFTSPHGCRIDPSGNLWLTDTGDHRVMQFTTDGRLLRTYGVKKRPGGDATHFHGPADVAFGSRGDIYIADGYGNSRIVHLSSAGRYLGAWGRRGSRPGEFHLVHSLAVDASGRVYVADRENARIQVFAADGRFLTQWRKVGKPFGLYLTPDQRLFVADGRANTIHIYDLEGRILARWGGTGSASGKMRRAHLLCVDDQAAVYVAEVNGRRIQKFVPMPTAASPAPFRR
jgi:DNA-binding beta-propeller fold protein YncE